MLPQPEQGLLFELKADSPSRVLTTQAFEKEIAAFHEFGTPTKALTTRYQTPAGAEASTPTYVNEFWTSGQRQALNLHEISYRACFKPQLPRFFIERLTGPGDVVYDPFMGRGTTPLEAALLGRVPAGNDINPLSCMLLRPRLSPPALAEVAERLDTIPFQTRTPVPEELQVFYHPDTLREILALKEYLLERASKGCLDPVDDWIRMVAINRLTGHSVGFFSVYTLPPNQAVSIKAQHKINRDRNQVPPRRDVKKIILRKSDLLLRDLGRVKCRTMRGSGGGTLLFTGPAAQTPGLRSGTVSLVVTSPPFLNVVDYATDNWLRCWFAGIDASSVRLTTPRKIEEWGTAMTDVFTELKRVVRPGGWVAFEVGEVRKGAVKLEETVLASGSRAGLAPKLVLINDQVFTKTANCWGVNNNAKGTNTNRIVLFEKS